MKKHKKKIIKVLLIALAAALLIGIVIFGLVYRYSYGFTEFDHPSPRRRYFDTLEELKEATKGKYLFPDYITPEIDPAFNPDIKDSYTLYAGRYSGLGSYVVSYVLPNGLVGELSDTIEDLCMIISFATLSHGYAVGKKDYEKEILLNNSKTKFYYQESYNPGYGFRYKNIGLNFIESARKSYGNYVSYNKYEEIQYYLLFSYICNNTKKEEEFIEYLENELIKIAESMLEHGLPDRKW
ncbi:MAG: hypothetical protein FWE14_05555 [Lachnospiraceae bacterium]|nr:hypothetical protein [Lachnospiraceae bacterium]